MKDDKGKMTYIPEILSHIYSEPELLNCRSQGIEGHWVLTYRSKERQPIPVLPSIIGRRYRQHPVSVNRERQYMSYIQSTSRSNTYMYIEYIGRSTCRCVVTAKNIYMRLDYGTCIYYPNLAEYKQH